MNRDNTPRADRNQKPLSVIAGLILVPISAVAAIALVDPKPAPEEPVTPASVLQLPAVVTTTRPDGQATAEDLAAACGPAGLELVAAEEAGSITDVQQAGLDALRQICEAGGMALPGKPVPEPVIETVVVSADPAPAPATTTIAEEEHDEEEEHEDEEEEDEDDHEDDEDHEDEHEGEGD